MSWVFRALMIHNDQPATPAKNRAHVDMPLTGMKATRRRKPRHAARKAKASKWEWAKYLAPFAVQICARSIADLAQACFPNYFK